MSYEYYIRSNKPIKYESNRVLGKDGIMPDNAEISINSFEDVKSNYKYNYYLSISEFHYFYQNKLQDVLTKKMCDQIISLIENNWSMRSEMSLEKIWEGRKLKKPLKSYIEVDYRLLKSELIEYILMTELIDRGILKIMSPEK